MGSIVQSRYGIRKLQNRAGDKENVAPVILSSENEFSSGYNVK
jgi:hypothetical protein